jgi:flagellar hook assembly protein FlgD
MKDQVRLEIYNAMGQRVTTLLDDERERGRHKMIWNGRTSDGDPVPTGLYFYRLSTGESTLTKKMIVLR